MLSFLTVPAHLRVSLNLNPFFIDLGFLSIPLSLTGWLFPSTNILTFLRDLLWPRQTSCLFPSSRWIVFLNWLINSFSENEFSTQDMLCVLHQETSSASDILFPEILCLCPKPLVSRSQHMLTGLSTYWGVYKHYLSHKATQSLNSLASTVLNCHPQQTLPNCQVPTEIFHPLRGFHSLSAKVSQ